MKLLNIKYLTISFLFLTSVSCTEELGKRIQRVNYGTSFGECVGFCRKQLSVTSDSVHFTAFCDACMTPATARKDFFSTPTKTEWDSIYNHLPTTSFIALPAVIGCPDCADGGAEWLELILINGESHKVTFEYGNEPTLLKEYIPVLRKLLSKNSLLLNQ